MYQSEITEKLGESLGSVVSLVVTPLQIEHVQLTIVNFYLSFVEQMAFWEEQLTIGMKYLWSLLQWNLDLVAIFLLYITFRDNWQGCFITLIIFLEFLKPLYGV